MGSCDLVRPATPKRKHRRDKKDIYEIPSRGANEAAEKAGPNQDPKGIVVPKREAVNFWTKSHVGFPVVDPRLNKHIVQKPGTIRNYPEPKTLPHAHMTLWFRL